MTIKRALIWMSMVFTAILLLSGLLNYVLVKNKQDTLRFVDEEANVVVLAAKDLRIALQRQFLAFYVVNNGHKSQALMQGIIDESLMAEANAAQKLNASSLIAGSMLAELNTRLTHFRRTRDSVLADLGNRANDFNLEALMVDIENNMNFLTMLEININQGVAAELERLDNRLATTRVKVIFVYAFTLIILVVMFFYISGLVVEPIIRIVNNMRKYANDAQSQTKILHGAELNNEVGELIRILNTYINNVQVEAKKKAAVVTNMAEGLITLDQDGVIQVFNPAAEKIFGYTAAELVGKNITSLMQAKDAAEHGHFMQHFQISGNSTILGRQRALYGRRKDGSLVPIEIVISAIQQQGKLLFIGLVRDISERLRNEKIKDEFVSTVSHELRTPLTVITGSLDFLETEADKLSPAMQSLLSAAQSNSKKLILLINDLLDMDKLKAGKMSFQLQHHRVVELLAASLQANQVFADQYQVTYRLGEIADSEQDLQINVDASRFEQVMANLLSNAAKFSHPGGMVDVGLTTTPEWVVISVTDYGIGIPTAFHRSIFEKFNQADSSDSRSKGGTGLGLAISRELVQQMAGEISFITEEGKGTTFYLKFQPCHG